MRSLPEEQRKVLHEGNRKLMMSVRNARTPEARQKSEEKLGKLRKVVNFLTKDAPRHRKMHAMQAALVRFQTMVHLGGE